MTYQVLDWCSEGCTCLSQLPCPPFNTQCKSELLCLHSSCNLPVHAFITSVEKDQLIRFRPV